MFNRHPRHPRDAGSPHDDSVTTVTDATFRAFTTGDYSVIDFYADWCGPCRQLSPIFDQAADRHAGTTAFGRLDVDRNPNTAARLGILSIPTIVVFDPSGHEVDRLVGATGARGLDAFLADATSRVA